MESTQNTTYLIRGGVPLSGKLSVQGSKNSLLPILAGCILRPGIITLRHVPLISDGRALCDILALLQCRVTGHDHSLSIDSRFAADTSIAPIYMKQTRGAFILLGAMLARFHAFSCSLPGGCRLGKRPIDFHLDALTKMGVRFIETDGDTVDAVCDGLYGCALTLPYPSVGATQNILLAACGANGKTVLSGAAIEPEVMELIRFLRLRGFDIAKTGARQFTVIGAPELIGLCADTEFTLSADRIAAVTYLAAAAITGGTLQLDNITREELPNACTLFEKAGCEIAVQDGLTLQAPKRLHGFGAQVTGVHPAFATDMQPLFAAVAAKTDGDSSFTETVFENRFSHLAQLCQMGAKIKIRGKTAYFMPNDRLIGRELLAFDLRGGAALTVAALGANGESRIDGVRYIARGYEDLFGTQRRLGAQISPL